MEMTATNVANEPTKQIACNSKIEGKLLTAPDDQAIAVTIVLHAKQWRMLLELLEYRRKKGNRRCRSLSGVVWDLVENAYVGMKNALSKVEPDKAKPKAQKAYPKVASRQEESLFIASEARR